MEIVVFANGDYISSYYTTFSDTGIMRIYLNGDEEIEVECYLAAYGGYGLGLHIVFRRYFASEIHLAGAYYLRNRYYQPNTGRFMSPDAYWHPGNMIYGDDPVKWNEREANPNDPLGLATYTYKPDITAIMQSGNLYAYCLSNPLMYQDPSGESIIMTAIIVGAVIGATVRAGTNVYGQIKSGTSWNKINWKSVGVSFAAGAISGGIAGSPIGLLGQGAFNLFISGAESVLIYKAYDQKVDWVKVGINAGIGGLTGLIGGKEATAPTKMTYGRLVSDGGTGFNVVYLTYFKRATAEAAAKSLAKNMAVGIGTQIIVTDNVVRIIYADKWRR